MGWWFGRILTFEVEADDQPLPLGELLADSSGGAIASPAPAPIAGYAAYGSSIRGAVQPLVEQFGVPLFDDGAIIRTPTAAPAQTPIDDHQGCSAEAAIAPRIERAQVPAGTLPGTLTLSYYDPARDYQTGQMRATVGAVGGVHEAVELPISSDAAAAKALAESSLARRWAERERLTLRLPPANLGIEPGATLQIAGSPLLWTAERVTLESFVARVQLRPLPGSVTSLPAEPGRNVPAPDVLAVPTSMALLDLPDLGFSRADVPVLHLAACSSSAGWRPVPVEISIGGELRAGQTAFAEAVLGSARTLLAPGQSSLLDLASSVEVELIDEEHWLESRDEDALVQGANLACIGRELIQFGSAVSVGARRFRLERLLRGRRGSEWAMAGHAIGEPFTLLNPNSLRAIELPRELLGASIEVTAFGIGDGAGSNIAGVASGEAMRPPSPVRLRAQINSAGALETSWVRRSRSGWAWLDEMDAPMGEASERYRARLESGAAAVEVETGAPSFPFTAAQLAELGPGTATFSVAQIGDNAISRAASIAVTLV